jgi:hypothetical protein
MNRNKVKVYSLLFLFILFSSGCIRVSGGAGYWHKSPDEEETKSKQIGFDTDNVVHPNKTPGSIQG